MDPKQVSDMDQVFAGLQDTAKVMGEYRRRLVEQGFSTDAAERLAADLNAAYWYQQPLHQPEEEDG